MSLSKRLFQLMLFAYPREFRLEYGPEMTRLFRDCYRDTQSDGPASAARLWFRMMLDIIRTAPIERWASLMKESGTMKNLKRDALGLLAFVTIIFVAVTMHRYVIHHGPETFWILGYTLDAIITGGVVGNLVIFLLVKTTRMPTLRAAFWSLLIVNGALLLIAILLGMRVGGFNLPMVFVSYVVSFFFWMAIHWVWALTKSSTEPAA
jgi:hypothetical protein